MLLYLSNYLFFEGIAIISIVWLATSSRAVKILDVGSKVIGSAASSTFYTIIELKVHLLLQIVKTMIQNKKDRREDKINKLQIKVPMKKNTRHSFFLTWILTNLDINVNSSDSDITQLAYGVFLLSLIAILCFLNIMGYLLAFYLIQKSDYEIKYPKLAGFVNYYKKVNFIFLIIEVLLCLFCLTILVLFSFLIIFK